MKHPKQIDFGFFVRYTFKKVTEKKLYVGYVLSFKNECIKFLSAFACKLLEKCPSKYPLLQYLVLFRRKWFLHLKATVKFETLLQLLLRAKWCLPEDEVFAQLKAFVIEMKPNYLAEFLNFKINESRLDEFYWNYTKNTK